MVLVFPDVEALICAHLTPILGVPVRTRVPDPRPARWVQVRRVGGTLVDHVRDRARLDVFAWGTGDADANDLGAAARAALHAAAGTVIGGVPCYAVEEFLGPRRADDPLTGAPRVWLTVQLSLRAT
ncbi:hypothetical protein SMC26_40305 [Actinomadura fulvescens]|uniref:DUF3168 domain-containing protein n=1 Tax=Actinomadura fulvescens TaxID=46160 RepID=A0ABN3Q6Z6_9ACTN